SGKCKRPSRPRPECRSGVNRGARTSEQVCGKFAHVVDQRRPESRAGGPLWPAASNPVVYFSSTAAPCASSFFLISSASCLDTPSFTVPGAPSTRSLASLRPRLVIARISLMTWIFFSPAPFRMTVNSVFSSAAAAPAAPPAAPPPAAGAAATGAAMVTPNFSLNFSISSASSTTDRLPMASMMSSLLNVCVAIVPVSYWLRSAARGALVPERLEGTHHIHQQAVQRADEARHRRLERPAQLGEQLVFRRQTGKPFHQIRRDGLAVHQPDLDGRLFEFLREVREHLGGRDGIRSGEHQAGRPREVRFQALH